MFARVAYFAAVGALLADVAPSPSCGSSSRSVTYLAIQAPSCACAPASIDVMVDGNAQATLACGSATLVEITPGRHTVSGAAQGHSWTSKDYDFSVRGTTRVDLGCPDR